MSIDKTDGCQVFLNKNCLGCEIFSAKSSEMNICVPKGDDDYVSESFTFNHTKINNANIALVCFMQLMQAVLLLTYTLYTHTLTLSPYTHTHTYTTQSEHALPEQFKSSWNGKAFVTDCSDVTA